MPDPLAAIPLSAIRIFEAAARLKSFTRAADELGVTQAAVSWQVKALESRLDQPLFRRLPREVVLTPAGERLARAAGEAMRLLRGALTDISEHEEGVLAITAPQSLAAKWLAPRIGGFQLVHPKIAVRIDISDRLMNLENDGFDLAVRIGAGDWPGLEAIYLFTAERTPLCTPATRTALGGLTAPSDLLGASLMGREDDWDDWFEAAGVAAPPLGRQGRLIVDQQILEVATAMAGQGVALGSPVLFAAEIDQGLLVRPFDITVSTAAGFWLVYPKHRRRVAKIAAFRDWLTARAAEDNSRLGRPA